MSVSLYASIDSSLNLVVLLLQSSIAFAVASIWQCDDKLILFSMVQTLQNVLASGILVASFAQ